MGFEDAREDFWRDRDDGPHSKKNMLRVLVQCGGVLTGREDGVELPYYGALTHLEELAFEGFAKRSNEQPIEDVVVWLATEKGRRTC